MNIPMKTKNAEIVMWFKRKLHRADLPSTEFSRSVPTEKDRLFIALLLVFNNGDTSKYWAKGCPLLAPLFVRSSSLSFESLSFFIFLSFWLICRTTWCGWLSLMNICAKIARNWKIFSFIWYQYFKAWSSFTKLQEFKL